MSVFLETARLVIKKPSLAYLSDPRSRHVLEKAGMHYVGKCKYYNDEVDRYEIARC